MNTSLLELGDHQYPMFTYEPVEGQLHATRTEGVYTAVDEDYHNMDIALDAARRAGMAGDNPVGCAYQTPKGEVVAEETREFRDQDLEAHCEKLGYKSIQHEIGRDLSRTSLSCTAEPCLGCAYMLRKGGIGKLSVAVMKTDAPDFFRVPDTIDRIWSQTRHELTVVYGIRQARALEILAEFGKKH